MGRGSGISVLAVRHYDDDDDDDDLMIDILFAHSYIYIYIYIYKQNNKKTQSFIHDGIKSIKRKKIKSYKLLAPYFYFYFFCLLCF